MTSDRWSLAGITDKKGRLERPIQIESLEDPPLVELSGERLFYRDNELLRVERRGSTRTVIDERKWVPVGTRMLTEFVRLAHGKDQQIENFARRWGKLGICGHGIPASHRSPDYRFSRYRPSIEQCYQRSETKVEVHEWKPDKPWWPPHVTYPIKRTQTIYWDPLGAWRQFSLQAGAILNAATALHLNGNVDSDDFGVIERWLSLDNLDCQCPLNYEPDTGTIVRCRHDEAEEEPEGEVGERLTLGEQKFQIGRMLDHWAAMGNVQLRWGLFDAPSTVVISVGGLFGALATQLAFAVRRVEGFAECSSCHERYVPTRKPAEGSDNYCNDCRARGIPQRLAQQRRRAGKAKPRRGSSGKPDTSPPLRIDEKGD